MAGISVKHWQIGELLVCRGLLCILVDVVKNPIGFNMYRIQFVDSGEYDVVAKHALSEIEVDDVMFSETVSEEWDTDITASDVVTGSGPAICKGLSQLQSEGDEDNPKCNVIPLASTSKTRHCYLNEEEINEVAKSRLSLHTENQTKWSVRLFKGE